MARKFLIDGNWLVCSEGTCMQRIQVNSQSTIYAHGKLVATMNDRMDGNFYCLKMCRLTRNLLISISRKFPVILK